MAAIMQESPFRTHFFEIFLGDISNTVSKKKKEAKTKKFNHLKVVYIQYRVL